MLLFITRAGHFESMICGVGLTFKWGPRIFHRECWLGHLSFWDVLPSGSDSKESSCNVGDLGLIPGLGRSHGEWNGYPL